MQLETLVKCKCLIILVENTKQSAIGDLQKRVIDIVARVSRNTRYGVPFLAGNELHRVSRKSLAKTVNDTYDLLKKRVTSYLQNAFGRLLLEKIAKDIYSKKKIFFLYIYIYVINHKKNNPPKAAKRTCLQLAKIGGNTSICHEEKVQLTLLFMVIM